MNTDLIKILGISLVTICCLLATYTDVKHKIIPNKLNLSLFFMGITLVTFYFSKIHSINYFYYVSILLVYAFSYLLWYFGVWAGGDVKLLTAISTIFIPEFLDILPEFSFFNIVLPYKLTSFIIPTFLLLFNSLLAIIPVIIIMVLIKIIKNKPHLIDEFKKTIDYKSALLSLNSLIISYTIIQQLNVYDTLLKLIFILFVSFILARLMRKLHIFIVLSLLVIIQQFSSNSLLFYIYEWIILMMIIGIKNLFSSSIVTEALTRDVKKNDLKEGMILAYPLYRRDNEYFFKKNTLFENLRSIISDEYEENLVCGIKPSGLSLQDIFLIKNNLNQEYIQIKEGLSFAPFILFGYLITLTIGNTYALMLLALEMI